MKLRASLDGRDWDVEVERHADGSLSVRLDSNPVDVDVRAVAPGVFSLLMGARSFEVRVRDEGSEPGMTRVAVSLYDDEYVVELTDQRRVTASARGGSARGPQKLIAPMHGKVVRVLVAVGQRVEKGQGLVVVEAMKMQNELKAQRDGTVTELKVAEGQSVHQGHLLCVIDPLVPA